jgi:hypothetical protein
MANDERAGPRGDAMEAGRQGKALEGVALARRP